MMPLSVEQPVSMAGCERRQLVSDLFHALNQPLTTLRCALELALAKPRTAEQYRETLSRAVENAEQVAWLSTGIRELLEADDPGDEGQSLALDISIEEVVSDLFPVAESAGIKLSCNCTAGCRVCFEPHRLRQALFRLLEFGLDSGPAAAVANIRLSERQGEAILILSVASDPGSLPVPASPRADSDSASCFLQVGGPEQPFRELANRLRLAIARGIFEASGGVFQSSSGSECVRVEVRLPLVCFQQ